MVAMKKYYAGIGSRSTPAPILTLMTALALKLGLEHGWTLRSGGAAGADTAFSRGADTAKIKGSKALDKEIYRPKQERASYRKEINSYDPLVWDAATEIARESHPAWDRCSAFAKLLHTRNVFQVLGKDLAIRSKVVICWTPDGVEKAEDTTIASGGTGTAIRIAGRYGVEVINLANPKSHKRMMDWCYK
jgi:hypothetical protein